MKELLNEVYMCENHASATISFQLKFIKSIPVEKLVSQTRKKRSHDEGGTDVPFTHVFCEEFKVRVPFVADDFST